MRVKNKIVKKNAILKKLKFRVLNKMKLKTNVKKDFLSSIERILMQINFFFLND